MQANAAYNVNKLVPPDALSYNSEGYVNDDEDISDIRSNLRRSYAPSEASEGYVDMNGEAPGTVVNSAYNLGNSVEVPREDPPGYEYIVSSNQYEEIPGRVYTRPPIVVTGPPPVVRGPPPVARGPLPVARGPPLHDHELEAVKEQKSVPQAKVLCSFWQGRTEIGLRATILIVSYVYIQLALYT